jgi:sigma-B regulation protein RsbU (phosphoserine phosphatase)
MMNRRAEILLPLAALALGAAVLAGGVRLARTWLPEWRSEPREEAFYLQRYRELSGRIGFRPASDPPRATVSISSEGVGDQLRELDPETPEVAVAVGAGLRIQVRQPGSFTGDPEAGDLSVSFLAHGVVWELSAKNSRGLRAPERRAALARLTLAPGESLGQRRDSNLPEESVTLFALSGSRPPQHVRIEVQPDDDVTVSRQRGVLGTTDTEESPGMMLLFIVPMLIGMFSVLVLFFVLLVRRRIDLRFGAVLGAVVLAFSLAAVALGEPSWGELFGNLVGGCFLGLWLMMLWSAGESLLRSTQPGLATSLDALRAGRLGPRGGRALLFGLSVGAALAGLRLSFLAAAVAQPGAWPTSWSLKLPAFLGDEASPLFLGVQLSGVGGLALAVAARFLPARWAGWGAGLLGGLTLPLLGIHPVWAQMLVNVLLFVPLALLGRRQGLAAILPAGLSTMLLPLAVFSALHLEWLPVELGLSAGIPLFLLVLGFVGLVQPGSRETERLKPPAFIRRQEEERRLSYEMDLLARMQLGLLPSSLPEIPGWEIAARSILATEAGGDLYDFLDDGDGRLWIAAGDVAGHGYSCAVQQAMTIAALSSLVGPGTAPAEVLRRIDGVLRRGARRNFTTLALVRLDTATGEAAIANAGHPFPLLVADGDATEVGAAGLPLGQGPPRIYRDLAFSIPKQGIVVFYSDGLFEATDPGAAPYGYDRPRELLRSLAGRSAAEVLEALLADWRRHLGPEEPADDTTIVVVKRK